MDLFDYKVAHRDSGEYSTVGQGNCHRLFALQAVSAVALRKVFERLPGTFEDKVNQIKKNVHSLRNYRWKTELIESLKKIKSINDADISLMYRLLRNSVEEKPGQGWDNPPKQDNISTADDIERIHQSRNFICHTDASEIETTVFNNKVLDLLGAIRRLSEDNVNLIHNSCIILNKVFTARENIIMQEKLKKTIIAERLLDQILSDIELNDRSQGRERRERRERRIQYDTIKLHDFCSPGILIKNNGTQATPKQLFQYDSICFMSRPMMVGEKVYIRGKHDIQTLKYHINHAYLRIGLTNINPYEFGKTEAQNIELEKVTCIQEQNNVILDEFVLGITLCPYRTCTLLIEKKWEYYYTYQKASIHSPLWLAIVPYGIKSIELKGHGQDF